MSKDTISLVFVHATGCHACKEALPELKRFAARNRGIRVRKFDVTKRIWPLESTIPIEGTPTYVLEVPTSSRLKHVLGGRTAEELEAWISKFL